jgi:hypothetical protein
LVPPATVVNEPSLPHSGRRLICQVAISAATLASPSARSLACLPELLHFPEDDPPLPLRQAGARPEYRCDRLVAQVLEEFRIEWGRLLAIHEVGGLHAGRLELMGR